MKMLNALSVRKRFGSIIDEVCQDGEPVVITRANNPLVVMISYDEYGRLMNKQVGEKKLRLVAQQIKQWSNEHEQVLQGLNAVDMIREVRQGK